MFTLKVLLLALFLFTTNIFAARVTYSAKFAGTGVTKGAGKAEQMDDAKADAILENMEHWSDGLFKATKHAATGIITVAPVTKPATAAAGIEASHRAQQIVLEHYKASGSRAASPAREGSPSRSGSRAGSPHHHAMLFARDVVLDARDAYIDALHELHALEARDDGYVLEARSVDHYYDY